MILCEPSEKKASVTRWQRIESVNYPCGTLYLDQNFQGTSWTRYIKVRDSNNRPLLERTRPGQNHNLISLTLSIQQSESLEKANVSMLTKSIHNRFNESITKYNESKVDKEHGTTQLDITFLDSVTSVEIINKRFHLEFVYDRKFDLKYIPSGLNECTIESSRFNNEFNYVASENYKKGFAKELYFPKNRIVRDTLLLGPYRMILCEPSEKKASVTRWQRIESVNYPCGTLYLDQNFQGTSWTRYIKVRDSNNRPLLERTRPGQNHNLISLTLSIQQSESLEKANVSMLTKSIHNRFNESITKYNESKVDKEHGTTQVSVFSLPFN
ncbi:uncharacterized protein LOC107370776 [Tetranychus urticae]|uniref:uncharacterized protein LOC107370776 n=1 Tax=Tetranychus urticae TaxID=32264 RepID=UPI000D6440FC|nr:uncharacterized protein LOC107370776 [Tetranychus urticae]